MNKEKAPYHFERMKQKYLWLRSTEILLFTFGIVVIALCVLNVFLNDASRPILSALVIALGVVIIAGRLFKIFHINNKTLASYLNRHYPVLRESVDLLLKNDEELSPLQQLQKAKTIQQFEEIYPSIKLPHHLGRAAGAFVLSVIVSIVLIAFSSDRTKRSGSIHGTNKSDAVNQTLLPASIKSATIAIFPPQYTRINEQTSEDFNLKIPEGTTVQWRITFEGDGKQPQIIFSARDSIPLTKGGEEFKIDRTFTASGFYQLTWTNADGLIQSSDYYRIEVIKDNPPTIAVENLNQFLELSANDNLKINLKAALTDDYELTRANIIATVSKGSGEAIKFREEKLPFDEPKRISGKHTKAVKLLDLVKLGLQPGDELYFYIEAEDNKPSPNRTRTETFFITLHDTSSLVTSVDAGLGVDLMPEYFRSQRQIIIDSEKLLREKKSITKQNFNERSNALAHDQKVLRLRYGEFLGEEFESSIGPQSSSSEGEDEDVQKKFGHSHDTENEHNLVEEKKSGKNHTHKDQEQSGPRQQEDPSKEYVHAHDSEEEATFFVQSIKAKLKAAVAIMWDAELHLRLYQPEKSLPYQYKALKLLKEISAESRIYVHRTGFDPPPLKEEKRLTADLSEIKNSTSKNRTAKVDLYPNITAVLPVLEKLIQRDSIAPIAENIKDLLTKAGQELASVELKQPGKYLKTLSWLRMITQEVVPSAEQKNILLKIRDSFWDVIPQETMNPQSRPRVTHGLDLQFLNNLEASRKK